MAEIKPISQIYKENPSDTLTEGMMIPAVNVGGKQTAIKLDDFLAVKVAAETNEAARQENEAARIAAETARDSSYQSAEAAREALYEAAETERENRFQASEASRDSSTASAVEKANAATQAAEEGAMASAAATEGAENVDVSTEEIEGGVRITTTNRNKESKVTDLLYNMTLGSIFVQDGILYVNDPDNSDNTVVNASFYMDDDANRLKVLSSGLSSISVENDDLDVKTPAISGGNGGNGTASSFRIENFYADGVAPSLNIITFPRRPDGNEVAKFEIVALRKGFTVIDNDARFPLQVSAPLAISHTYTGDADETMYVYLDLSGLSAGTTSVLTSDRFIVTNAVNNNASYRLLAVFSLNQYRYRCVQHAEGLEEPLSKTMLAAPNVPYALSAKKFMYSAGGGDALRNTNQFATFVHITDVHGDEKRAARAFALAAAIDATAVLGTGDYVKYNSTASVEYLKALSKEIPFLPCIGNHDAWTYFDDSLVYTKYIEPFVESNGLVLGGTNATYFYKDIDAYKLRVISLNQWECPPNVTSGRHYYFYLSAAQLQWLCSTLLSTPAGYGIIILDHAFEGKLVRNETYGKFWLVSNNDYVEQTAWAQAPIREIVDAYISGTVFNKSYSFANNGDAVTVSADFSTKNENTEFIAHINGHWHRDFVGYYDTVNPQLCINETCTNAWINRGTADDLGLEYSTEYSAYAEGCAMARVDDTPTQDSFNVYVIDRANKRVNIVRIGADMPFDLRGPVNYMSIPYTL